MTSLVMIPSSSLPSSAYYTGGASARPPSSSLSFRRSPLPPASPSSTWSPSISPTAQQQQLSAASQQQLQQLGFLSAPASSPPPGAVAVMAASPLLLQATPAYSVAGGSGDGGAGVVSHGVGGLSNSSGGPLPLVASSALPARQTIMVNEAGQAFLLSPVTSFVAAPQPQPQLARHAGQSQQQQSLTFVSMQLRQSPPQQQQTVWLTAAGGGMAGGSMELLSPAPPPMQSALSPAVAVHGAMYVSQNGQMLSLVSDSSQPAPPLLGSLQQQQQAWQLAVPANTVAGQHASYTIINTAAPPPSPHCVSTPSLVSVCALSSAAVGSSVASPAPACSLQPSSPALPVLSAFHTPTKRAATVATTLAMAHPACVSTLCTTKAVTHSLVAASAARCSGSELYSPARHCSSSSSVSSASSSSVSFYRLSMEETEASDALSSSVLSSSPSYHNTRAGGDGDGMEQQQQQQQQQQRIDGMSSSRLLTHISKKPTFVLPFTLHRSQLPGHFDAASSAASAIAAPLSPSLPASSSASFAASASASTSHSQSQSAVASAGSSSPSPCDSLTVNIRVMGGPSLSELYFVAADISQLIHSRKSNIAKVSSSAAQHTAQRTAAACCRSFTAAAAHCRWCAACQAVSVFSDIERARCSVVCPRSNRTQSTHILTVLSMAGVRRLLSSSRATIALPFLAWLTEQVEKQVEKTVNGADKTAAAGGGRTTAGGKRRASLATAAAAVSGGEIMKAECEAQDVRLEQGSRKRSRLG